MKNRVQYVITKLLGIAWGQHEGQHYKCVVFQSWIVVSEMELIFTFAEFLKTLMRQVCLFQFEQINPEHIFPSWSPADRHVFA